MSSDKYFSLFKLILNLIFKLIFEYVENKLKAYTPSLDHRRHSNLAEPYYFSVIMSSLAPK